jgi:large subunit ribosomal protein L29
MKTAELRTKSADELNQQLLDLRKEQFNFRIQKATGQMESVNRVRIIRRDIAKIKTILAETKSGKAPAAKKAPKAKTEKKPAASAPAKKKTKE